MLESSIVSDTSASLGAGKVLDKRAHFKEGAIDFTAGSLGKSRRFKFNLQIRSVFFMQNSFCFCRWSGIGVCQPAIGHCQSENASISDNLQRHDRLSNTNIQKRWYCARFVCRNTSVHCSQCRRKFRAICWYAS